jgi:hypothetical protein
MNAFTRIVEQSGNLRMPNREQTAKFQDALPELTEEVLESFRSNRTLLEKIGPNPVQALGAAQLYLGRTMSAVFTYRNPKLQIRLLPWVYRSYTRHGFLEDYFHTFCSTVQAAPAPG